MAAGRRVWLQAQLEVRPDYKTVRSRLKKALNAPDPGSMLEIRTYKSIHIWSTAEISELRRMYTAASPEEISEASSVDISEHQKGG